MWFGKAGVHAKVLLLVVTCLQVVGDKERVISDYLTSGKKQMPLDVNDKKEDLKRDLNFQF